MSELVAIAFENPFDADRMLTDLSRMQTEHLIDLADAVVAVRQPDGKVQIKQCINRIVPGAVSGGLWGGLFGALIGLLFLHPLAGFAVGSVAGVETKALAGELADYGISDDLIRSLADALKPDTSALFVLVRKAQPEKVLGELSRFKGRVLRSSLSADQESRLQQALSAAGAQA